MCQAYIQFGQCFAQLLMRLDSILQFDFHRIRFLDRVITERKLTDYVHILVQGHTNCELECLQREPDGSFGSKLHVSPEK